MNGGFVVRMGALCAVCAATLACVIGVLTPTTFEQGALIWAVLFAELVVIAYVSHRAALR